VAGKALGNVSPDAVIHGRREGILIKRSEVKAQTLASRKRYNTCSGSPTSLPYPPDLSLTKVSHFCGLPTPSGPTYVPMIRFRKHWYQKVTKVVYQETGKS